MPTSIKRLFSQSKTPNSDGLKQEQREAIVDLLHYCMYADNFVALKEDQFINNVAATLSWDGQISFETYEGGSIANARRAKESSAYRADFLASIKNRLATIQAKELALGLVKDLFSADKSLAEVEAQQLPILKMALGLG